MEQTDEKLNYPESKASEVTINYSRGNNYMKLISFLCSDFACHFPRKRVSDYANVWGMRSLRQFTVCFWMKSSDRNNYGTPLI